MGRVRDGVFWNLEPGTWAPSTRNLWASPISNLTPNLVPRDWAECWGPWTDGCILKGRVTNSHVTNKFGWGLGRVPTRTHLLKKERADRYSTDKKILKSPVPLGLLPFHFDILKIIKSNSTFFLVLGIYRVWLLKGKGCKVRRGVNPGILIPKLTLHFYKISWKSQWNFQKYIFLPNFLLKYRYLFNLLDKCIGDTKKWLLRQLLIKCGQFWQKA
jgi:hypothetical protein